MPEPKVKKEDTVIDKLNTEVDDDKLTEDDLFEKLLNTKVDIPSDDDPPKKEDVNDLNKEDNGPTREELEEKIATLEKEAKGRLNDTVKSRQEKAIFKTELGQLKSAVSSLLDKKQDLTKESPPLEDAKRKVEFAEDESAFVDLEPVKSAISLESEKTQKQINELKQTEAMRVAKEHYDKTVNDIISIDKDRYDPAYSELQKIMTSLNNRVIEAQNRTGTMDDEDGGIDPNVGLDLLDGSPEEEAFLKDYPGVNPTNIVRAFDSKRDLKFALDHISATVLKPADNDDTGVKNILDEKDADLIKKAAAKPGTLSKQENQGLASDTLLDRIGKLDTEDIMNISDAEADKIMKLMLDDELRGD